MKVLFEINTTVSQPFDVSIEDTISIKELSDYILQEVENRTILYKNEILDIFLHEILSEETLSILNNDNNEKETINKFMQINSNYFINLPLKKNKLFVIDVMYRKRLIPNNCITRENKLKLNHSDGIMNMFKKIFYNN